MKAISVLLFSSGYGRISKCHLLTKIPSGATTYHNSKISICNKIPQKKILFLCWKKAWVKTFRASLAVHLFCNSFHISLRSLRGRKANDMIIKHKSTDCEGENYVHK